MPRARPVVSHGCCYLAANVNTSTAQGRGIRETYFKCSGVVASVTLHGASPWHLNQGCLININVTLA